MTGERDPTTPPPGADEAGRAAHDLANELTAILDGAEVLVEALAADPALRAVGEGVRDAARRAAQLAREVLALREGGSGPGEAAASSPARSLRVLVVDDEPNVRRSLSLLLRGEGHAVEECAGGREAVARYREAWRDLDVVILDMTMPDLRGDEVLAHLRATNPEVAVIFSSGFAAPSRAGTPALPAGVQFLRKPYTPEELARALAAAAGPALRPP